MADMASAAAGHDGAVASGEGAAGRPAEAAGLHRGVQGADPARVRRTGIRARARRAAAPGRALLPRISTTGGKHAISGAENGLTEKPAGRPGRSTEAVENERLRRENEKLTAELARTKAALEVVGKAHALLELLSESADSDTKRQQVIDRPSPSSNR